MTTISLTDPRAVELRAWLLGNCQLAALHGCSDQLLASFLADAESDSNGLIEIRARDSVSGETVTYQVTA